MFRWVPYAFIRISFFFIAGILSAIYFGDYLSINQSLIGVGLGAFFYVLSKLFLTKQYFYSLSWIQGLSAFLVVFLLGYLNLTFNNQSLRDDHLVNHESLDFYYGHVHRPAEEKANTFKYEFLVERINQNNTWQTASGKIYIYIKKDQPRLQYGDRLLVKGQPNEISPPMNPGEFDYKRFLTFNNVYHQDYITTNYEVVGSSAPNVILAKAFELRRKASLTLKRFIKPKQENDIAQALVLGVKDGLDRDIKYAYSASGAMHVLAVSGLHVGIVYGLILLLFKPFRKTKTRNWLLAIVSLCVLWSYALITGFSPSVLRAVTMFSFVAIAQASNRNTNIYNTLAASGFILLLVNPYLIMSVGFQLSFLAVFGIVFLQPRIYNAWEIDNYWLDKVWTITAVSIAAQIATIPLTLLYFHQFPTFFLISNLVVIPGAFIILCLGLLLLFSSPINLVAESIGWLLEQIISLVNYLVFSISAIPYSQVTDIEINTWQSWFIICAVVSVVLLFEYRKFKYVVYSLLMVIGFSIFEYQQTVRTKEQRKIIFHRVSNHTAINLLEGTHSQLLTDSVFSADREGVIFHVRPTRLQSGIVTHDKTLLNQSPAIKQWQNVKITSWKGKKIALLDTRDYRTIEFERPIEVDFLVIGGDFNKKIDWVLRNFKFEKIILDGSLKWYLADQWRESLNQHSLDNYSVYHDGALTINLNE
ncbi:ComEC family competence protein [Fulvivirga sp. RKSG066]|uniref:ComEC/Rec2 family competence protein n=1 Tax=Fulvivirga aurantia TaxID=2529383 RepID=UPI0012BBF72F|nr:ComEC/Rec2 family competence protein [Fulvivirga aurantia]MTI20729.1 ComEC family competence protein [Fulvivirga aurantia]